MSEIQGMTKKIGFNILTYYFTTLGLASINFARFKDTMGIYNDIKNGNISIEKAEEDQKQFKSDLNEITRGNPRYKKEYQLNTIANIKNLYNSRKKVIDLFNNYAKIRSEATFKTKQGTGLKIITPKQMLQRLPIALAKVKEGNNSEHVLNEIRQIVYSLYQSKEITKKLYNKIIKSMQL